MCNWKDTPIEKPIEAPVENLFDFLEVLTAPQLLELAILCAESIIVTYTDLDLCICTASENFGDDRAEYLEFLLRCIGINTDFFHQ